MSATRDLHPTPSSGPSKPRSPLAWLRTLARRAWRLSPIVLLRRTFAEAAQDHIGAFAGNLAYNALLAIFPFLLFLLLVLRLFGQTQLVTALVSTASRALPDPAARELRTQIVGVAQHLVVSAYALGAIFLALGSLWAASAAFRALMVATNRMYEVRERRSLVRRVALSVALSLAAAALLLLALVVLVAGTHITAALAAALGAGNVLVGIEALVQWAVLLVAAWLAFSISYAFAPDLDRPVQIITIGSVTASLVWLLFSAIFSLVLDHFAQFLVNPIYGWFAGLIILLLYMYYSAYILLLGAELNQVLERAGTSR